MIRMKILIKQEEMKRLENIRNTLCMKYKRNCILDKCPMRHYGCYDYHNLSDLLGMHNPVVRERIINTLNEAEKSFKKKEYG